MRFERMNPSSILGLPTISQRGGKMNLFPKQGSLQWTKYPQHQPNSDPADHPVQYTCNYFCFIMIVNYRPMVDGKPDPKPYYTIVSLPGDNLFLQEQNEEYDMPQLGDPWSGARLWDVGNSNCFATLEEAQDHCIKVVNLYLNIIRSIPTIEEKPPAHSESRKEGASHGQ